MVSLLKEQLGQEPILSLGHHQTLGVIFYFLRLQESRNHLVWVTSQLFKSDNVQDIIRFALAEKKILLIPKMVLGCC